MNVYSNVKNFMDFSVNGYFGGGCGTCAPAFLDQDSYQIAEDLDIIRGRHHISVGVDGVRCLQLQE